LHHANNETVSGRTAPPQEGEKKKQVLEEKKGGDSRPHEKGRKKTLNFFQRFPTNKTKKKEVRYYALQQPREKK